MKVPYHVLCQTVDVFVGGHDQFVRVANHVLMEQMETVPDALGVEVRDGLEDRLGPIPFPRVDCER